MTTAVDETETACARCGRQSTGRFCEECGAPLRDVDCVGCGRALKPGAKYCNHCGAGVAEAALGRRGGRDTTITKWITGGAVLLLIAFVAGQFVGRRSAASPTTDRVEQAGTPLAGGQTAPDISNMSPEERANRLFNRVMTYTEQGKLDSARFFAPMAIQAYQMVGPLDAHARYDIGHISAAVGEISMAKLEADSILAAQPTHLLGLVLAIRAAELGGNQPAKSGFQRRLVAADRVERAKGLKEYTEHGRDIDAALKQAGASP